MTTTCQRVALISSGSTSGRLRGRERQGDFTEIGTFFTCLAFVLIGRSLTVTIQIRVYFLVMQIYLPLMAFNAGTPILLSSWPPGERRRDYAISAGCDAGFLSKQDILRSCGCEHRRTETLSSSLSSFFSFYSLFNKGIMVITIEINKRYQYDEISRALRHYLKAL